MLWSSGLLQFSVLVSIILINLCSFLLHFPIVFFLFVFLLLFSADITFSIDLSQVFLFHFSFLLTYFLLLRFPIILYQLHFYLCIFLSILLVPFKFLTQDSGIGFLYFSLLILLKFFGKLYSLWKISLIAQLVKNPPAMQVTPVQFLSWEDHWRRDRLPTSVFWPGEFHGLVHGVTKSRTWLSDFYFSLSQSMRIFNMVWLD